MKKMWEICREMLKKYREQISYLIVGGLTTAVSLLTY